MLVDGTRLLACGLYFKPLIGQMFSYININIDLEELTGI